MLLDTYAPLKRVDKYKLKFKSKSWITVCLQKSISVNNKLLTNALNKKDPILKEECHTNYKKCRHLLSTLMNNIKNTWKRIKPLKTVASSLPTALSHDNGDVIVNLYGVADTFYNYFTSVTNTTKKHEIFT